MEPLTPRQKTILNRLIEAHIETAQPVGSRLMTERYQLCSSPATVRHEMGVLEEMGYLTHPHPSAGRVPTDGGYRYYVDHCLHPEDFSDEILDSARTQWLETSEEPLDFPEQISSFLSLLSQQAGLVLVSDRRLFLQGSAYILDKPEFQDLKKVRILFRAFEEKKDLIHRLSCCGDEENVSVTIGRENEPEALQDCSVISAPCKVNQQHIGTIAVVGPRRMRYSRIIPLVRQVAQMIRDVIRERGAEPLL